MADFRYDNAITNQKNSIADGNVVESGIIALIDEIFRC